MTEAGRRARPSTASPPPIASSEPIFVAAPEAGFTDVSVLDVSPVSTAATNARADAPETSSRGGAGRRQPVGAPTAMNARMFSAIRSGVNRKLGE